MTEELIKRLNVNEDFKDFHKWFISEINKFDTVSDLGNMSRDEAGDEAKARCKAKEMISKIFSPFNIIEKKEPSIDDIQRAKDKRGL